MYNYKGMELNIPEGLLKKYHEVTGLPLNDVDICAFLHDGGCNENTSKEDKEIIIAKALQTELDFWG